MDKPNFYAILTAPVRYDNRLKAAEKILYAEITALSNVEGYCFAGNGYFADLYGVDKRTIQRWLMNLKKYGYIQILSLSDNDESGADRKITPVLEQSSAVSDEDPPHDKNVVPPTTEMSYPPRQNCHTPHDKIVTHNNTRNNNTRNNNIRTREKHNDGEQVFRDFAGEDSKLLDTLMAFRADRSERNKPMTTLACKLLCRRLDKLTDEAGVHDRSGYMQYLLCAAVEGGWQTVYARDGFADNSATHQPTGPIEDRPRVVDDNTNVMDIL